MAQMNPKVDWTDKEALRDQAKHSVRAFMAPHRENLEAERPLSPGLVARITEPSTKNPAKAGSVEDANIDRVYRETERSRINQAPHTTWPG